MSTGAEKLLASVIEGDGADVPISADELGRITLPVGSGTMSEADAQAIAGYAHIIGAAASIIIDPHSSVHKSQARELINTCRQGLELINVGHTAVEADVDEEQTT